MKTTLLFFFTCCTLIALAQAPVVNPVIQWQKSLGGAGIDNAYCIRNTTDGGYIVAGESWSNDGDVSGNHGGYYPDYWVVKLDNTGTIQWQKCLGGTFGEEAHSIQQTKDGGYIVAGSATSNDGDISGNHGGGDYWIVKLDNTGTIQWQKCLGGSGQDYAYSVQQTKDGGYIVAGNSWSNDGDVTGNHGDDYWIVKLDSSANIQWQRCLGGSSYDYAYSILQTKDSGYIVAGTSYSNDGDVSGNHGLWDYWIVKLNGSGTIQWQKCLGGSSFDVAYSIDLTKDGGYIVAGYSESNDGNVSGNHGSYDYWIVKLSTTGAIQWQKSLGGSGWDFAHSIQQAKDAGYIVAGSSGSDDGDVSGHHGSSGYHDYWIVKLSSTGAIQKSACLGGTFDDYCYDIRLTDSSFIMTGSSASNNGDVSGHHGIYTTNDYWVVKLKPIKQSLSTQLQVQAMPQQSKTVLLSFCCNNEINGELTVEKSKDGIRFITAGAINVNTQHTSYSFTDNTPFSGNSYYRLQQTDFDGSSSYSNAVVVNISNNTQLQVLPNPSHTGIFTATFKELKKNIVITVTDNTGKKVYADKLSSAQQLTIFLNNKPKGIYYLHVSYDGGTATAKLVVE